jgi:preprotein translocase subunit SecF
MTPKPKPTNEPLPHRFLSFLPETHIPFMKYRKIAYVFSALFFLVTLGYFVTVGPMYSVDFTGGTLLQVQASKVLPADHVRAALQKAGLGSAELQSAGAGDEILIRLPKQEKDDPWPKVKAALEAEFPGSSPELRREETVGPKIGEELRGKAIWAVLLSLLGILVYVGVRYEFKFALGAVVALFHDVFAAFGVIMFAHREVSLTVIAALLTLAGYSINDTIVVFDRIRERGKQLHKLSHEDVMNTAMNETLSRTVITSLTVFLSTLALYIFGGEVINDFALAMLAGVIFGTYSSIYVASALALDTWNWLDRRKGVAKAKAA